MDLVAAYLKKLYYLLSSKMSTTAFFPQSLKQYSVHSRILTKVSWIVREINDWGEMRMLRL